jgi:hypothetical protein
LSQILKFFNIRVRLSGVGTKAFFNRDRSVREKGT